MPGGSEAIGTDADGGEMGSRGQGLAPFSPPPSMGTPAGEVPGARARENPSLSLCFVSVLVFLVFS